MRFIENGARCQLSGTDAWTVNYLSQPLIKISQFMVEPLFDFELPN